MRGSIVLPQLPRIAWYDLYTLNQNKRSLPICIRLEGCIVTYIVMLQFIKLLKGTCFSTAHIEIWHQFENPLNRVFRFESTKIRPYPSPLVSTGITETHTFICLSPFRRISCVQQNWIQICQFSRCWLLWTIPGALVLHPSFNRGMFCRRHYLSNPEQQSLLQSNKDHFSYVSASMRMVFYPRTSSSHMLLPFSGVKLSSLAAGGWTADRKWRYLFEIILSLNFWCRRQSFVLSLSTGAPGFLSNETKRRNPTVALRWVKHTFWQ